jgi:hypothetical protein
MLDDPSIGMTFNDFWMIDSAGTQLDEHTNMEAGRTHRDTIPAGPIDYDLEYGLRLVAVWNAPQPAYAAVLRRDVLLSVDFPEDTHPLYDIWLSYDLVKRGIGLRYEPRRLTYYRVHLGAVSSAGFAKAEDAVFRRILGDNKGAGPVTEEIAQYWGTLQWARGTRLMTEGSEARSKSQIELRGAAKGLQGPKKAVAWTAGHIRPVWHGLQLTRSLMHRFGNRDDPRYTQPQGAVSAMTAK